MTPPSSGSMAATPPIENPYPQWMSGIARLAPWMPGRNATLATCSGAWSLSTLWISFSLAKISPSTRIPCRYDFGMRQQHGSTCSSGPRYESLAMSASPPSDVHDHLGQEAFVGLLDLQP